MNTPPIVTAAMVPPAATVLDQCFWCQSKIGQPHKQGCSAVTRRAKVRAIIEYEVDIHGGGDPLAPEHFEYHRNEGSWCSSNMLSELDEIEERDGCLCRAVRFAFVAWVSDDLKESR